VNIPVATALGRRDRFWPAVTLSAAVHAAAVIWALARTPPPIDLDQKPLRARLVRLGEKRPETFLPRKEEPPPAPEPQPVAAPPQAEAPPAQPPPAAPGPAPAATTARTKPGAAPGKPGASPLAAALSRVRKEVDEERRWGDPEGDPGGDSDTGEGDRYHALVERALRASYDVPSTISDQERLFLKAIVLLYIEPDGRITRWRFTQRSGNAAFDAALERTMRATRLPPPPDAEREYYRRTGLQVLFKI
jgi:colicin import membrane protein/protein TonB